MPLRWIDGFEDATGVQVTNGSLSVVTGRTGNCVRSGHGSTLRMGVPLNNSMNQLTPSDIILFGAAMFVGPVFSTSSSYCVGFMSGGIGNTHEASLFILTSGAIEAKKSSTTSIGVSAAGVVPLNQWFYFECLYKFGDAPNGQMTIRINGVQVLNLTSVDTKTTAAVTAIDALEFNNLGAGGSSNYSYFDDLYLCTGSISDPFLGDCRVSTLLPIGNGDTSQWVGSDGNSVDNFELVEEQPPTTTDYVQSSTVGHQDLYQLADLPPGSQVIHAVAPTIFANKDEVGPRTIKPVLKRTTTNVGTGLPLDFTPKTRQALYTTDPETSSPWTSADVNALQVGVEVG